MIPRRQKDYVLQRLNRGKALIIYGARQVGKTTFARQVIQQLNSKALWLNGDEADTRAILANPNTQFLKNLIGDYKLIFIDEVQRIENSGILLKLLVDQFPDRQVIATGSSSFAIAGNMKEPLTGRKYEMKLYPPAYQELVDHTDFLTEQRSLEDRLIWGSYPEIIMDPENKEEHLRLLADSYLYRDLLELEGLKKPKLLEKLIKALALQVGSEVSFNEIGKLVGADFKTVEKYLQLLEEAFVVFTLPGFNRNLRNEIRKGKKVYFYDNGILNAVTGSFKGLHQRSDVGALWENYLVSERIKWKALSGSNARSYFWRTTAQQEIDYVEENGDQLLAAEFKWNPKAKTRISKTFLKAYPEASTLKVDRDNYYEFLGV